MIYFLSKLTKTNLCMTIISSSDYKEHVMFLIDDLVSCQCLMVKKTFNMQCCKAQVNILLKKLCLSPVGKKIWIKFHFHFFKICSILGMNCQNLHFLGELSINLPIFGKNFPLSNSSPPSTYLYIFSKYSPMLQRQVTGTKYAVASPTFMLLDFL